MLSPTVFLDFDGTVTTRDVTDAILEAYAAPEWVMIEEAWNAGRIGSRECLSAQMALVDASAGQIDALLDGIGVDPGFVDVLDWCAAHRVAAYLVSDGFDYCIRRILARPSLDLAHHLGGVEIVSSHLRHEGTRWRASFTGACGHGCATCKPAAIERLKAPSGPSVFVGDGLSDRYAAAAADIVFAKDKLAAYCRQQLISYTPFDSLETVVRVLESVVISGTGLTASF